MPLLVQCEAREMLTIDSFIAFKYSAVFFNLLLFIEYRSSDVRGRADHALKPTSRPIGMRRNQCRRSSSGRLR